ncbi:unannotated protein [freshwater metagenome]|uniref:Unannotated protein n=1 Tax=freshwater metagenome TaxID=449393 RepID=A0A6J7F5R4_9ZZZZ
MATTASLTELPKNERIKILVGSIIRTLLGFFAVLWALSLVPENPDASLWRPIAIIVIAFAVYATFFRRQIRKIENSRYPTVSSIEALILIATMFLAFFASIYVMMSGADPTSFTEPLSHFTAFYFALTVLATVGFGDITPVSDGARFACMIQMAIDIVFIAAMIRVVSSAAQKSSAFKAAKAKGSSNTLMTDL